LLDSDLETGNKTTFAARRLLLGDAFTDRHIPTEMIGTTMEQLVFYMVCAEEV
jgi:hypothetical protein